ncbi:MAG: hypothetical protein NVS4B3_04520 [Gemmatimonadaceae bacterium]
MPELRVQLTKRADGGSVLRCVRADGTMTWQRHDGRQARFFPLHDLTHFVVEREIGFGDGFYGLVARGWDISDTDGKGARGSLPDEALMVEYIVGCFDAQRAARLRWTAAEFNEQATMYARTRGTPRPRTLTEADLARVWARLGALLAEWSALARGATLELLFDRPGGST